MQTIEITEVEKAIADYRAAEQKLASFFGLKPAKAKKKANGKVKMDPSNGRAMQGKYLGAIRHLTRKQRLEVKKVRGESGVTAAIKHAEGLKADAS